MSLSPQQLAMRREGITATDVVILSGESPYGKTAHDVWLSKMGIGKPFEQTDEMRMGHALESVILARVAELKRVNVVTPCATKASETHSWAMATVDGEIRDDDGSGNTWGLRVPYSDPSIKLVGLVEAKAVGLRMMRDWRTDDDEYAVPSYVEIQCQWGMFVRGWQRAIVGALIGTEVFTFDVAYDANLVGILVDLADRFRTDHVLTKEPPIVDGSDSADRMLKARFPRHRDGALIRAGEKAENWAREYFSAKQKVEQATKTLDACRQSLMNAIGENEGAEGDGWKATWKNNASGGVDWKGVATELGATPEIVSKYTRSGPRVFRCVPTKGES